MNCLVNDDMLSYRQIPNKTDNNSASFIFFHPVRNVVHALLHAVGYIMLPKCQLIWHVWFVGGNVFVCMLLASMYTCYRFRSTVEDVMDFLKIHQMLWGLSTLTIIGKLGLEFSYPLGNLDPSFSY